MKTGHRKSAAQSFERTPPNQGAIRRARTASGDVAFSRQPERYVVRTVRGEHELHTSELRSARTALYVSAGLLIATCIGCAWILLGEVGSLRRSIEPLLAEQATRDGAAGVSSASAISIRPKDNAGQAGRDVVPLTAVSAPAERSPQTSATPADMIARSWSALERKSVASAGIDSRASDTKGDRLASIAPSDNAAIVSPRNSPPLAVETDAKTALVEFATAPFPYSGNVPGTEKPFLDVNDGGRRGHTNLRGRVLREAETFNDRRALLHIPPRFDPKKPGVIVVFFHGHGANLSDDVRDRQQVPAQISASNVNAVMVAPQFAVNAADSSAGKFWEQDGFKRFLDEAAVQFAKLQGDPRAARAFAKMPIVIAAYSGGFGPTLSVLERGGANSRIRGVVLLDALYTGTEKFADWIAANRSAFFVSSYTPHIQRHNTELKALLDDRSITYSSELKPNRLPGSVTFLPASDVSHRDFVTSAWTEKPITAILERLDDSSPKAGVNAKSELVAARR